MEAEARLKANRNAPKSKYVNLDFVLGSAAEVERLWSMAKYVLSNQRKSMSPLLLECLMYLKFNRKFWDASMVADAYRLAQTKQQSGRLVKKAKLMEEFDELKQAAVLAFGDDD